MLTAASLMKLLIMKTTFKYTIKIKGRNLSLMETAIMIRMSIAIALQSTSDQLARFLTKQLPYVLSAKYLEKTTNITEIVTFFLKEVLYHSIHLCVTNKCFWVINM